MAVDGIAAAPAQAACSPHDKRHGVACVVVSTVLGLTQGLGVNLVNNNLPAIQGSLGATAAEATWLTTAYFATSLSAIALLTKARLQFGLRRFAQWSIAVFLGVAMVHFWAVDLGSAIAVRAALGLAAAPLSTLAVLYMVEAFPAPLAPVGLLLGFATLQFGAPLSRILSEGLLQSAQWRGLQWLEVALALASLAAVHAVVLRPPAQLKVLNAGDAVSFALYAAALALFCVVCTQGRTRWWTDSPWLGGCLAGAFACLGAYVLVERKRRQPLLDLHWLASPFMLRFIAGVLLFRIMLSEQPVGAVGLMNALGFGNDQMHAVFAWVAVGTAAGFALSLLALPSRSLRVPGLAALVLIFVASLLDADATSLTRPHDLYLSQTLLATGTAMFLSSSLLLGFIPVVLDGMKQVVSFLAVFSGSQMLGSLIGSAWLGTFVADRQRLHFARITEHLTLADPQVAARVAQLAGGYASSVLEPAQRAALGAAALAQRAGQEAFVLAYNDLFERVAVVAALSFIWLSIVSMRAFRRERAARRTMATEVVLPEAAAMP
jgi:MFS family permease